MTQIKFRYKKISKLAKLSSNYIKEFGVRYFITAVIYEFRKNKFKAFSPEPQPEIIVSTYVEDLAYQEWLRAHKITDEDKIKIINEIESLSIKNKISLIVSVSEKNIENLKNTLDSLKSQIYNNWEARFVYSNTISIKFNEIMTKETEPRFIINTRDNDSINKIALSAKGDYIAFIDSGNIIHEEVLFNFIKFLNKNSDVEILYFDEDQIEEDDNRNKPFFKPDWSPDLFLSLDYISNFYLVKKSLFNESGGFQPQFHDVKHFELLLRLTEITKRIHHIPLIGISILNFTNSVGSNDDMYSEKERYMKKALQDALKRRRISGEVVTGRINGTFKINYFLGKEPRVTIIIPTKDQKHLLNRCIKSIEKNTSYRNYEIIIVNNNSVKPETLSYFKSLPHTVLEYKLPFNFSKINNLAVSHASGDYLLFLNDDTAVLDPNWLTEMVSLCQQENVGVVGAKLVFADNTIQHAGIVLLKTGAGFHPLQRIDADSTGYFGFLNIVRNFAAVTGACLLTRKKIFEEVGGFDEDYDLYYGDVDLCIKILKKGYRVVYTPYARLLHQGSSSITEKIRAFFAVENHYTFTKKWPWIKDGDPFYNPNLSWNYKISVDN